MGGVCDEASLRGQRRSETQVGVLELSEHLVEAALQSPDFVIRRDRGQTPAQVLGATDLFGGGRHLVQRPQGAAGYQPAQGAGAQQAQQRTDDEEQTQVGKLLLEAEQRLTDEHVSTGAEVWTAP